MSQIDQDLLVDTQALRNGNARLARDSCARVMAAGRSDASSLLCMAASCRALHAHDGVIATLKPLLVQDPRNLHALILTGDAHSAKGDTRSATSF